MIFETERLLIRKLILEDLKAFHALESNPKVLKYATGNVKSFKENQKELEGLILKYSTQKNDFWIYAIVRKHDSKFVGTVALIKDGSDDEVGYRFLEEFWGNGYATELCEALLKYCKQIGIEKLVGYVVDKNIASAKILERFNFKKIKHFISDDLKLPETKYQLYL